MLKSVTSFITVIIYTRKMFIASVPALDGDAAAVVASELGVRTL